MKKYLIVVAALFALSCGTNDKKTEEPSAGTETKTSGNALYGKWKVVGVSVNGRERDFGPGTMEFKETGEYIGITGGVYKFKINGDSLLLTNAQNQLSDRSRIVLSDVEKGTLKLQTLLQDTLNIETVFQKE